MSVIEFLVLLYLLSLSLRILNTLTATLLNDCLDRPTRGFEEYVPFNYALRLHGC
jgi:hypothetical protein